jgi:signal transduction histidine kinase
MFRNLLNWRSAITIVAIAIALGTILYSSYLGKKIAADERAKMELWVAAKNTELQTEDATALNLTTLITTTNTSLPIIWTTHNDSIIDVVNIDTTKIKANKNYAFSQLQEFKKDNPPIIFTNPLDTLQKDKLYYGKSALSKQIKWFPIIQLFIIGLFIIITLVALHTRNKSTQNQLWAGMAKETAHQLGTPLNSLAGWVEVLKSTDNEFDKSTIEEMEKDVHRLNLVSERFSKIGSIPKFETVDIKEQILQMTSYMQKRASGKVSFGVIANETDNTASISPQLFDWVIENILKNALDALEGKGKIDITILNEQQKMIIDIADNGKGIPRNKWNTIFKPGYTTKKRGWGLGLSLTKRIVEQYHKGQIFIKESTLQKGTTFRIIIPKYAV